MSQIVRLVHSMKRAFQLFVLTALLFFACEQPEQLSEVQQDCTPPDTTMNLADTLLAPALADSAKKWYAQSKFDCALPYFKSAMKKISPANPFQSGYKLLAGLFLYDSADRLYPKYP